MHFANLPNLPTLLSLLSTLTTLTLTTAATTTATPSTTTLQIFNGGDSTTIPIAGFSASIIAVDSTATTLAIDCGDSSSSCALPSPITITEGPSTFTMSAVYATSTAGLDGTVTLIQDCEITSSTQGASCSVSMAVEVTYEGVSSSTATSTVTSLDGDEIYYQAVTATAGVEKLSAPKATESAGGAAAAAMGMGGVGVGGAAVVVAAVAAWGL